MKLREAIEKAIRESDPAAAAGVADVCRFRFGMNYQETFAVVAKVSPDTTLADWDALLYAADQGY